MNYHAPASKYVRLSGYYTTRYSIQSLQRISGTGIECDERSIATDPRKIHNATELLPIAIGHCS